MIKVSWIKDENGIGCGIYDYMNSTSCVLSCCEEKKEIKVFFEEFSDSDDYLVEINSEGIITYFDDERISVYFEELFKNMQLANKTSQVSFVPLDSAKLRSFELRKHENNSFSMSWLENCTTQSEDIEILINPEHHGEEIFNALSKLIKQINTLPIPRNDVVLEDFVAYLNRKDLWFDWHFFQLQQSEKMWLMSISRELFDLEKHCEGTNNKEALLKGIASVRNDLKLFELTIKEKDELLESEMKRKDEIDAKLRFKLPN